MCKGKVEFQKVKDKRGKRIRGLWRRESVFYVQLRVTNPTTGKRRPQKLALDKTITTIPQALQAQAETQAYNLHSLHSLVLYQSGGNSK